MKKITVIIIALLLCAGVFAQGELQFNRAVYLELSVTGTGASSPSATQIITVPAGKVWKIEYASAGLKIPGSPPSYSGSGYMFLNDRPLYTYPNSANFVTQMAGPIWLPAGTYTLMLVGSTSVSGYVWSGNVSAIEFNILP